MAITNLQANAILTSFFSTQTHFLGLHVTDPTNAGLSNTEVTPVSAPTYGRKQVTWSTPANRSVSNTSVISWTGLPLLSIAFLGAWSTISGGNLLAVFSTGPIAISSSGGSIFLPVNSLIVALGGSLTGSTGSSAPSFSEDPLSPGVLL